MAIAVQQLFRAIQASDFDFAKRAFNLNPSLVHAKHPRDCHTPLHAAAALGNLQLLRDLLHHGASCQALDCNNERPLHVAARQGHTAVVRELLTDAGRRSCLKSTNRDGATPLHLAIVAGHADVVQALVNAGARIDATDRAGRTPQDLVSPAHTELADILAQGRQLTPASSGRTVRRTGSPTLSPQPRRAASRSSSGGLHSGAVSPASCAIRDAQGRAADNKRRISSRAASADTSSKRASASSVPQSPFSKAADAAEAAAAPPDAAAAVAAPDAESSSGSGASQPGFDLLFHPDHNEQYNQQGCALPGNADELANAEKQQEEQQEAASKPTLQHYSTQRSLDATFRQAEQQQQPASLPQVAQQQQPASLPQVAQQQQPQSTSSPQTSGVEPLSVQRQACAPLRSDSHVLQPVLVKPFGPSAYHTSHGVPVSPATHPGAATAASWGSPGALGMHYHQQRQQQQVPPQQPIQLGPLRSARAAGPLAASAAAAAVHDLARSFDYHPPASHGVPPTPAAAAAGAAAHAHSSLSNGGLRQQLSHGGATAAAGSYIVSPEASSGLLQGPAAAGSDAHSHLQQAGANTTAAACGQAAAPVPAQHQELDAAAALPAAVAAHFEHGGPLSVGASFIHGQPSRRSVSALPGSGPHSHSTAAGHSHDQPPHTPCDVAALAAAVSASSRVGPLSQPLQAQLVDLAAKVGQLEAWFEAQVELIPEWQKVLDVVLDIKRQLEQQQARQEEQEDKLNSQQLTGYSLAAQLAALEKAHAADSDMLACVPQHSTDLAEVRQEQASLKASIADYADQLRQLQAQVVHQASVEAARNAEGEHQVQSLAAAVDANAARMSTLEESQVAPLSSTVAANSSRMAALEAGLDELRKQLQQQQQDRHEASGEAADGRGGTEERLAALESSLAELRLSMAHAHGAGAGAAPSERSSAAAATSAAAGSQGSSGVAVLEVQAELGELRARVADLSACLGGASSGAVEETFLPFMETTSNCLQQHEQQLDTIQALVPKLESVVAQRTQMCELMQQVAALQTAFNLMTGTKSTPSKEALRPSPSLPAPGPMGSHKAAADHLAMATSMVKLQSQMGALSAAVEQLQVEWDSTSASVTAQQDAIKSGWEAERSRLAAAEREAVRRLADQQRELRVREERLTHIREAALAEEAARRGQLDSEARVDSALAGMGGQQEQLQGRLAGLADTTDALREQLAALQAEVESSLINLGPHISAMMAAQEQDKQQQDTPAAAPDGIDVLRSSLDSTNPIYEPEPEDTPRAAGGSARRVSSGSIGWQQHDEACTSTALAHAATTGSVCHLHLLPVPEPMALTTKDSAAGPAASGMLRSAMSAPPGPGAPPLKKVGWLSRTLSSHSKVARHQHRYATPTTQQQQQQHDEHDFASLDQAAAGLSDSELDVSCPEQGTGSGRVADQALVHAGLGAGSSQIKHAGSSSSKWKTPWLKLGFGGKGSSSAAAAGGADVTPLRGC